jgi:hypothetical protein
MQANHLGTPTPRHNPRKSACVVILHQYHWIVEAIVQVKRTPGMFLINLRDLPLLVLRVLERLLSE